jgi:diguanylate cyclase
MKLDLSPRSWGRVIATTVLGTLFCVAVTIYVDSFNFPAMEQPALMRAIFIDVALPIGLAVPLLLFFTGKLRELAIAHERLTVYASTDALTNLLNRAAFSTLVDAYLREVRNHEQKSGTLLVVDADNFKAINDTHGHDSGDEALKMIASAIKSMLRTPDIVGRLGGEEFGVFLPGADARQAGIVAERIRHTVFETPFVPNSKPHQLSVSIGGAAFEHEIAFHDLFRLADQQLYVAKQAGRNKVAVSPVLHYDPLPMAAA